jgi:hypothetical protein
MITAVCVALIPLCYWVGLKIKWGGVETTTVAFLIFVLGVYVNL